MYQLLFILGLLLVPVTTLAHSGGIDSRGGHHCKTDCEIYGLEYGSYHFHPNVMDSTQLQSYSRLRGSLCGRVFKRFARGTKTFDRVQVRIEKRFGFICGENIDNEDSYKTGYDIIETRRRAERTQVTRVIDGDTIEVREPDGDTEKVRFIGINTPEVSGYGAKPECFGKEASLYVKRLLARKSIELIPQPGDNRDKYRRLLRYVHLEGQDIGLRLIVLGYAYNFPWFEHPRSEEYAAAEIHAQQKGNGLWAECK